MAATQPKLRQLVRNAVTNEVALDPPAMWLFFTSSHVAELLGYWLPLVWYLRVLPYISKATWLAWPVARRVGLVQRALTEHLVQRRGLERAAAVEMFELFARHRATVYGQVLNQVLLSPLNQPAKVYLEDFPLTSDNIGLCVITNRTLPRLVEPGEQLDRANFCPNLCTCRLKYDTSMKKFEHTPPNAINWCKRCMVHADTHDKSQSERALGVCEKHILVDPVEITMCSGGSFGFFHDNCQYPQMRLSSICGVDNRGQLVLRIRSRVLRRTAEEKSPTSALDVGTRIAFVMACGDPLETFNQRTPTGALKRFCSKAHSEVSPPAFAQLSHIEALRNCVTFSSAITKPPHLFIGSPWALISGFSSVGTVRRLASVHCKGDPLDEPVYGTTSVTQEAQKLGLVLYETSEVMPTVEELASWLAADVQGGGIVQQIKAHLEKHRLVADPPGSRAHMLTALREARLESRKRKPSELQDSYAEDIYKVSGGGLDHHDASTFQPGHVFRMATVRRHSLASDSSGDSDREDSDTDAGAPLRYRRWIPEK